MAIDPAAIKRIIKDNRRVLVGLAHYDTGEKVKYCDRCYCSPAKEEKAGE